MINKKMFCKRKIVISLFFLLSVFSSYSQDISNVDIDTLSDEKITIYVQNVKSKGYTIEQAVAIAKTRGMSNLQAQKLLDRIKDLEGKQNSNNLDNKDKDIEDAEDGEKVEQEDVFFGLTGKEEIKEEKSELFGYDFFSNPKISFTPNLNIATPENYILGAGDVISIDLWGAAEANYEKKVSKQGAINIPGVGYINVRGLPISAAKVKIKNYLKRIYAGISASSSSYNKVNVAISVKEVRNVQVNITGEVKVPSSYSLSGFSTILNALYAAGGPTENGTFRQIKLFRGGEKVADFDFYEFLLNGSEKGNITVQDQDAIIVRPYEKLVKIEGAVKRPGIFELKKNETFGNLLEFCGGFTSKAYKENIVVERISGIQKEIVEIKSSDFSSEKLKDGDFIKVNEVIDEFSNKISIAGAVFQPGKYQYKKNLTLADLLKKAEGYTKEAFLDRGIVVRTYDRTNKETLSFSLRKPNNKLLLRDNDSVYIYSKDELKEKEYITINGAVNKPDKFDFMKGMRVEDLIVLAGGLKDGADASVIDVSRRLKDGSLETVSENFNIKVNQNLEGSSFKDFSLQPFDEVSVRYLKGYTEQKKVKVEGEVNYTGEYSLSSKNQRISDLIEQAGGLTRYAYLEGAFLSRKNNATEDKKQLELIESFSDKDNDTIAVPVEKIKEKDFFKIGIDLKKIMSEKRSKYDLILEEGDELFIPSERQTVKVEGEVMSPSLVRYEKGKSFKQYIESSGGFSSEAKKNRAYVVYANGDIKTIKSFLFFKSYPDVKPGSVILVPLKTENKNKITTQEIIAITTGLATLGVLVKTLIDKK